MHVLHDKLGARGGEIAKHNSILFEFPSSVDPAFKFAASTGQKLITDKMEFPVFLFLFFFLNAKTESMLSFSDAQTLIHAFVLGHLRLLEPIICRTAPEINDPTPTNTTTRVITRVEKI